jgi:hypothetical protein
MPVKTKINFFPYISNGHFYDELTDIPQGATNITQSTYPDILSHINIKKQIGEGGNAYIFKASMDMPNGKTKHFVVKVPKVSHLTIVGQTITVQSGIRPSDEQRTLFDRDIHIMLKLFTPYKITNPNLFSKDSSYALIGSIDYDKVQEFRHTTMLNHPGISYLHKFEYIDVQNLLLFSEIMDDDVYKMEKKSDINTSFMLQFQLQTGLALDYCLTQDVYLIDYKTLNVFYTKINNYYHFKISDFDGVPVEKKLINTDQGNYTFSPAFQLPDSVDFIRSHWVLPQNMVWVAWIMSFYQMWFSRFYDQPALAYNMRSILRDENSKPCQIMKKYFLFIFDSIIELKRAPFTYYTSEDKTAKFKDTLAKLIELYNKNTEKQLKWRPSAS